MPAGVTAGPDARSLVTGDALASTIGSAGTVARAGGRAAAWSPDERSSTGIAGSAAGGGAASGATNAGSVVVGTVTGAGGDATTDGEGAKLTPVESGARTVGTGAGAGARRSTPVTSGIAARSAEVNALVGAVAVTVPEDGAGAISAETGASRETERVPIMRSG